MGLVIDGKRGRGRPRKYVDEPDAVELLRRAEFEALTPKQQAKEIADDIELELIAHAELSVMDAEEVRQLAISRFEAELAQAQARKLKKAVVKSYNVPVGDSRLNVNVKTELHDKLKSSASEKGITVGRLVEMLIIKYL